MTDRSLLRAEVVEISGNQCEHPWRSIVLDEWSAVRRCPYLMAEMAHITPRGMGHKGDRDVISNVMAACVIHARSTDDLSSSEWQHVPGWMVRNPDDSFNEHLMTKRQSLATYVNGRRVKEGWAML